MNIDWSQFTPIPALLGGALIGLSACLLLLGIGRIAGITGILAGLIKKPSAQHHWRYAFLIGLFASSWLFAPLIQDGASQLPLHGVNLAIAGFLVGIGTRLAKGCTSGHGVCGLARLSTRSLVATLCFISSGVLTVYVVRHFSN